MSTVDEIPLVQKLLSSNHAKPPSSPSVEGEWKTRASKMTIVNMKEIEGPIGELDAHLTLRSFISGHSLSTADLIVWGVLRSNRIATNLIKQGLRVNVTRWYTYIEASNPWIADIVAENAASANKQAKGESKRDDDVASYDIGLQDTERGVVTRFPPEPSGFLHIGHAKAALLNDYFAHQKYKGTLILRFDDTNPSKETQEFEDSIIQDLKLLGITADKTTHTSDYFQELYDYCVQMIKSGNAYADDTEREKLSEQRMDGIASARRDMSPEESLKKFEEMKTGSPEGQRWYIRAKISVDDPNKALRDPVVYRCNPKSHHRTGDQWKIYPTYDFACPIIDAHEGVTHALRTTEYNDRDPQYQWILKAMKMRNVYNWNFSRLNFVRTLLSKRKLTQFVNEKRVWGWDDPRMPTIRGIRRRGMTIEALQEFILKQGPSRNVVNQEWGGFWATNKKYIDLLAARYTAVTTKDAVECNVVGAGAVHSEQKALHAKHNLGNKKVVYSSNILIEQADAVTFEQDEEITLMNWGNAIVRKINHSMLGLSKTVSSIEFELHLQGDFKKTSKKITWLSKDQELVPVEIYDFDYLITKDKLEEDDNIDDFLTKETEFKTEALADCNVANLKEDGILQFDRKGYYRIDRPFLHGKPAVMFDIPSGRAVK